MNIITLVNTDNISDIPTALRLLADIVEKNISIQGDRANSIGHSFTDEVIVYDFDYQIQNTNMTSISQFISP